MSLSARDKHSGSQGEAWQWYLWDDQEKLAGQIQWNDDLIKACKVEGVLDTKECEDIMGKRPEHRGNKFIRGLKKKTSKEFTDFANILNAKGYKELATEMRNMTTIQKDLQKEIQRDVEGRMDASLRGTRLPPGKREEMVTKVTDYMQGKAYQWRRETDNLTGNIKRVNEQIHNMCRTIIEEARGYTVDLPLNVPPTERLDACVRQISDTCNKLYAEKEKMLCTQSKLEQEKAVMNCIIQEQVQELTKQKQELQDTQKELEKIKKSDKSKARIIENLQIQLKNILEETEQNLKKVRKLESLEQNMEDKHAEVATLKRTLDRRDEELEKIKKSDKSKARIIENLQIQLKCKLEEIEQNLKKVRKLESLEQNMEDKHAEVAILKRTLDRRDEKINQMEQEMFHLEDILEACKLENDELHGRLDILQRK